MSELLIFQSVLALVLFVLLVRLLRIAFLAADAHDWPEAEGEILASMVSTRSPGDAPTEYVVEVQYSYSVNGQSFEGSRPYFGSYFSMPPFASRSETQAALRLETFRPHARVKVRYDPRRPWRCTLRAGTSWEVYVLIAALTAGFGVLITYIVSALR